MKQFLVKTPVVLIVLILGLGLGYKLRGPQAAGEKKPAVAAKEQVFTCSMHPQIRQNEMGLCPLCGMDLVVASDESLGPWQLELTDHAKQLASIQTAKVKRQVVSREVRMIGKVEYDEKRLGEIAAWVDGRVDHLYVDFTGVNVNKNDHLVELYAPDLLSAQQELLTASGSFRTGDVSNRRGALKRVMAAREKLRLMGLNPKQIAELERRGTASDRLTIYSHLGGIVIKKHVVLGSYVKEGEPLYTVADLSKVWVKLDAYEEDLAWLRYGQEVEFETLAFSGKTFKGTVIFIDPVLDPKTRTVKVRLNVDNPHGELKPDMFVKAVLYAKVGDHGGVVEQSLKGKWISPMHPEVIKDGPGQCDVCGMDLVKAEEVGLADKPMKAPLVIPASAPLLTGNRAVVYVAIEPNVFEGREVVLGPRTGDYFVVLDGLEEGEFVVTNGNFKIDSELQIRAGYSMMYHESKAEPPMKQVTMETGAAFHKGFQAIMNQYFATQEALSKDEPKAVTTSSKALIDALAALDTSQLSAKTVHWWIETEKTLANALNELHDSSEIGPQRTHFETVSDLIYDILKHVDNSGDEIYRFHCPMAFDNKGASWLQNHKTLANPYFGASMLRCGSQTEILQKAVNDEQHNHQHGEGQKHD